MTDNNTEEIINNKLNNANEKIQSIYNSYLEEQNINEDLNNWFLTLNMDIKLELYLTYTQKVYK